MIPLDLTDDEREAYEERAAIMEFDGEMTRQDAERRAMEAVFLRRWRGRMQGSSQVIKAAGCNPANAGLNPASPSNSSFPVMEPGIKQKECENEPLFHQRPLGR